MRGRAIGIALAVLSLAQVPAFAHQDVPSEVSPEIRERSHLVYCTLLRDLARHRGEVAQQDIPGDRKTEKLANIDRSVARITGILEDQKLGACGAS